MARLGNTAEAGSDGAVVSNANSGGGAYSDNAFDTSQIAKGVGSTLEYDNARAAQGSLSIKCQTPVGDGVSGVDARYGWESSFGTKTFYAGRITFNLDNAPTDNTKIHRGRNGTSQAWSIQLNSSRKLQCVNAANGVLFTSTSVVPLDTWVRVEYEVSLDTVNGDVKLWYFANKDDVTPTESLHATGAALLAQTTQYQFGLVGRSTTADAAGPIWLDEIDLNDVGRPGPFVLTTSPGTITSAELVGQPSLTSASGGATTSYAWTAAGIHASGFQNSGDFSPLTSGEFWTIGDVMGVNFSSDGLATFSPRNNGLFVNPSLQGASIKASETVVGRAYALLGGPSAGFWRYDAGPNIWTELAPSLVGWGGNANATNTPAKPASASLPGTHPRSTGKLIALFEANGFAYVGTFSGGLVRVNLVSGAVTNVGLQPSGGNTYFIRGIFARTSSEVWVAVHNANNTQPGGVYKITNANTASPTVTYLVGPNAPTNAEEIAYDSTRQAMVVAAGNQGIKTVPQSAVANTSWLTITGNLTANSAWCSVAVQEDGSFYYVGCADPASFPTGGFFQNIARLAPPQTTWEFMTNSQHITYTIPGTSETWFLSVDSPFVMLGKSAYVAASLVIDKLNPDVLASVGRSGTWRCLNAKAAINLVTWAPAVRRQAGTINRCVTTDPNDPEHVFVGNTDWVGLDSVDGGAAIVQRKPPSPGAGSGGGTDTNSATAFDVDFLDTGLTSKVILFYGDRDDNTFGEVFINANPKTGNAWTDLNLNNMTNGKKPIGGKARRINNVEHVIAVVANDFGDGDAQTAPLGGGILQHNGSQWTRKLAPSTNNPFVMGSNKRAVVCWTSDTCAFVLFRGNGGGIYRNDAYPNGAWERVWTIGDANAPLNGMDDITGFIAPDPTDPNRLWVTTDTRVYRWDDASTGSVSGGGSGAVDVMVMVEATSQINSTLDLILAQPGVAGVNYNIPWNQFEPTNGNYVYTNINAVKAKCDAAGKIMTLRLRGGQNTPQHARGRSWTVPAGELAGGAVVPMPCDVDGSPNAVYLAAYQDVMEELRDYCIANGVPLLHGTYFGGKTSEKYVDAYLINNSGVGGATQGNTQANVIAAHEALCAVMEGLDPTNTIAVELPVGAAPANGTQGYHPASDATRTAVIDHFRTYSNSHPNWKAFMQGNAWTDTRTGWGYNFEPHGQQMIGDQLWNWPGVFAPLVATDPDASYVEIHYQAFARKFTSSVANEITNSNLLYSTALQYAGVSSTPEEFAFPRAGAIAVDENGTVVVCRRATNAGPAAIFTSNDEGETFIDISDGNYRNQAGFASDISIAADGTIYVSTNGMGVAVGTPTATTPTTQTLLMSSVPSGETIGIPTFTNATPPVQTVSPGTIVTGEIIGLVSLTLGPPPPDEPPPEIPDEGLYYYLPPTTPHRHKRRKLVALGAPRSRKYQEFFDTWRTDDNHPSLSIAGETYLGGRWNGPLTLQEVEAIFEAGYSNRIVNVMRPEDLPVGLD